MNEAKKTELNDPNALALATSDKIIPISENGLIKRL